MALVKGPFEIKWGGSLVTDIETIETEFEQDSEDYNTVDGRVYTIEGAIKAGAVLTLLRSEIAILAALLPQYFVANGGVLSTGETVNQADGAIDLLAASCDTNPVYGNLDIISCGNPGQVYRLVNARTKVETVEFDDKVRKVQIRFIGEPEAGEANVQFFTEGTIAVVS